MQNISPIPTPTVDLAHSYISDWDANDDFVLADLCIKNVFEQYPSNIDAQNVLAKVVVLNDLFSTNIFRPIPVARHIVTLNIDQKLKDGSLDVVDMIALVSLGGKTKNFYSFATKYCHYHAPDTYPIYDSYVARVLVYFRSSVGEKPLKVSELREYEVYLETLSWFGKEFRLTGLSVREMDIFLWMFGKKYFPRQNN